MDSREASLASAIAEYNAGIFSSISASASARAYGVPKSILLSRLKGIDPKRVSHEAQQRLTSEQEEYLYNWVFNEDARGNPPSITVVRDMAFRIMSSNSDYRLIGKN